MSENGWGTEEIGVQHLGKNGAALIWIPHHHIHHFVIAGVTQGLMEGTVHERGAQNPRMELALHVRSVARLQIACKLLADGLEALEQAFKQRHDRLLPGLAAPPFELNAI